MFLFWMKNLDIEVGKFETLNYHDIDVELSSIRKKKLSLEMCQF